MCLCLRIAAVVQSNLFDIEVVVIIGGLLGAKFAWLRNHEMTKFWPDLPFPKGYANFGGPAGVCSLRARFHLLAGMWLVEAVLRYRQSSTILQLVLRSRSGDEHKIRENIHVFIDCSGFEISFAISARQFALHDVFVLAYSALGPGKFV